MPIFVVQVCKVGLKAAGTPHEPQVLREEGHLRLNVGATWY